MRSFEDANDIIKEHWEQIRLLVLAKWDKIHETDLWDIHHNMNDLIVLIQKKYHKIPKESIIQDLENLIYQYKT